MMFFGILLYMLFTVTRSEDFRFQPRIVTQDGHLLIYAAEHKNVSFLVPGNGGVHINGVDILQSAKISNNALQALKTYQTNFATSFDKISKLERLMDDGVFERIMTIQGSPNATTDVIPVNSNSVVRSVRRLNRRINLLQKSIRMLTLLLSVDECASNPCKNGGTCVDMFNGYLCHCPPEWTGNVCDRDVNECARFAGTDLGCQNGATCINRQGSYECVCPHGWFGLHCTRRTNDCKSGSNSELCGHGICVTQYNDVGYKCICDQGWTTDGKTPACNTDVNECTMNTPPCSVNPPVPCINLPGSFHCGNCPPGYSGNGYHCTDINECTTTPNGGCSTNPMVQCINTLGSRICGSCPPGYAGDGVVCTYSGVCNVNNGGCHPLATCRNNPRIDNTAVECACPSGYVGNGIGALGCTRSVVPTLNACNPNPCTHGTCRLNGTSDYYCECYRRYTGRNCEAFRNLCISNPCQNGGSCISLIGMSYRCICATGYAGYRCENERHACGGQLTTETGVLAFPASQFQSYDNTMSCAWTIETNETQILNITFSSFDVEDSLGCRYDWLQIHDGKNTLARSFGRFCGHVLPNGGTIITTHNTVYLWFRSDHSVSSRGFNLTWTSITPFCGQDPQVVTSHGTIHSPGSPGNYPNSRDCYWPLQTQPGKRLVFHFYTLMIGNNSNCDGDYLEFITGTQYSDPVFAKFCNTSHPTPLFSQGSEVLVHFHSDSTETHPGFQITYSVTEGMPGCGGIFTQSQGDIRSPSFNGQYPNDVQCEWKIQLPSASRVKLTFLSFEVEDSEGCRFDYVAIYAGATLDAPLVGKYCGYTIPPAYITEASQLLVVLKTDWSTSFKGFALKYETVCGGTFTAPSGTLQSPGYPNAYEHSLSCIYEIIQPLGTVIQLNILHFNLESHSYPDCEYDFLEIRDGHNENSTLVGKYCHSYPDKVISSYNYLYLKFESDDSVSGDGFQANYTTTNLGCGGIIKDKSGTFSTPNYPELYSAGTTCKWIIYAPPGHVIQLIWMNFKIEKSYDCTYDFVEVFDNNTETGKGTSVGKYCGTTTPPNLLSTSNLLTVVFQSDSTQNFGGFLASYNVISESSVCGGNYYTEAGTLKSPNYPNHYPMNTECTWTIQVKPGHQILLKILDFELEKFSVCRYDWLEIRNGGSAVSPLLGKYCGTNIPKVIPSHTNKLYIHFRSDMTRSANGFKITWEATATGCGGTLNSPTGAIISPNYPEPYSINTECLWRISVNTGSLIQVVFSDLDLEDHTHCGLDYVELLDGPTLNSKSLGRFCSSNHPSFIRSTSNSLTISFRSDLSRNGRGFQLLYTTICNNTLTGFRGVIESPNFPNNYPNSVNCNWEIKVTDRNKINISFSHFDLEKDISTQVARVPQKTKCIYDFVEVLFIEPVDEYEEEDGTFQKYGSYCGNEVPPLISLNSSHAKIRFVTDNLLHGNGFRLEWQIDGCGDVLTHPNGTISSPNYPQPYPPSVTCQWKIVVDFGQHIEITFSKLELEHTYSCHLDYVKLYNGEDDTYPEIASLCHQDKPLTLRSSGNVMFIKFQADSSLQGLGFTANYTSRPTKCGGKYVVDRGSIMSPNYPQNYDVNDTCGYSIEVTDGHTISLKFEEFDLFEEDGASCDNNNNSYVKLYDGPTKDYVLLAKICGKNSPNKTFVSTTNELYIEMVTRTDNVAKGFLAKYEKTCGARIVTEGTGTIRFNPNDLDYGDYNCSWTIISADPSGHVSLTITHLDMNTYCDDSVEMLKIYNGPSSNSPLLASYCGSKVPPTLTSDGSALHINIDSNSFLFATYSVFSSHCGGTLTSLEGSFASPGYPRRYPDEVECEWTLEVSEGNHVSLSFSDFHLVEMPNCNTDYLEIRQDNGEGKLLGTFCGDDLPSNLTNVGSLWIYLKASRTLDSFAGKGFKADYILNHHNELTGASGRIVSPLYKQGYPLSGEFTWQISVNYGKRVLLTFKEMVLEGGIDMCFGSIKIYDGPSAESSLINEYCGSTPPDAIKTTSNTVFIYFSTYITRTTLRFILEWSQFDPSAATSAPTNVSCGSSTPINVNSLKNYTIIQSPGYPNGYDQSLNCEWIFTTTQMNHLNIRFKDLDLHPSYGSICYGDFVEIFEKKIDADWTSVQKVCKDNITGTAIQTSNMMKVVFKTDRYGNRTGFSATVEEACGGVLTDPTNFITYDNTTRNGYQRRLMTTCQWNITVRPGKTIEIEFLKMDIHKAEDEGCRNYLMIRNGKFADSPLLGDGKYCGTQLPPRLKTTSNNAYIKYDGHSYLGDFILKYREVSYACGGDITLTQFANTTEINSPNYPQIPPPYVECMWRISAPPGEIIRIDFPYRFDVSSAKQCSSEFVEVRDGATIYSKLVGKFCGKKPNSQFTTDNMMFVRFFTQLSDPGNGFKARLTLANCGGTIHDKVGQIQSPFFNMPSKYPLGINCTWHLIAPSDHSMELKFDKIDLEEGDENCTDVDHVWIYEKDRTDEGVTSLGTFCGKQTPSKIQSADNEVLVNLQTSKIKKLLNGFSLKFNSNIDVCGGTIEAPQGTIQSPGYPSAHKSYRRCGWFIVVPRGRRVTLKVEDFDLNSNLIKSWLSGVNVYNDRSFKGFIKKLSSSDRTIESSDNHIYVYYWNTGNTGRGFKLSFSSNEPTQCAGNLNEDSGIIKQPDLSIPYYCTYLRENQPPGTTFVMSLTTTMQKKPTSSCLPYKALFKIESDQAKGPIKTVECVPSTTVIRSPFNHLKVLLEYSLQTRINYTLSYNTYQCGGLLTGETGTIKSPGYPNKYSQSVECAWLVKIPSEQSISLNLTDVDFGDNCQETYLDIYNGDSPNSPKLDRVCQNHVTSIISQTNYLWIEYKFNKNTNAKGFSLTYEPKIQGCGGVFHDHSRIIETPSFPHTYPDNAECLWELRSDEGYNIGLVFTTMFQLEETDDCRNDFVEIWDWRNEEWYSLGRKCGREMPKAVNSTSNRLKILFRSNNQIGGRGFRAKWEWNCGGTFIVDDTERFIVSPGFPLMYKENLNCRYNITSGSRYSYINIKFYSFELEGSGSNCKYDNLTISNPLYRQPGLSHVYCGQKTPPNVRLTHSVQILFQTDHWVQKSGFKFSYQLDNCGGPITSPKTIHSPTMNIERTPMLYNGYMNCVWNITAPPKKMIVIRFQKFKMIFKHNCYFDNVEIFEGTSMIKSRRLANLCGDLTDNLPVFKSENGSVLMTLKADRSAAHEGFTALVYFSDGPAEGCGGTIKLEASTTIVAPNLLDMDCSWFIQSDVGTNIKLHFDEINLPVSCGSTNRSDHICSCASLEIKDGHPSVAPVIEKFCGTTTRNMRREFSTSGNFLGIRLYTKGLVTKAFQVNLRAVPSICGPVYLNVTNEVKSLVSPGYPDQYPSDIKCTWSIKGSERFVLRFVDFDLNDEGNQHVVNNVCGEDRLELMDESQGKHILADGLGPSFIFSGNKKKTSEFYRYASQMIGTHQFCGKSDKPFDYYSNYNSFLVKFSSGSNDKTRGKGFKIEYHTTGCNRNFTSLQGRIMESFTTECYITITVPTNYTISATFQQFMTLYSNNCERAGVEVRDGSDKGAVLVQKSCGYALPNPVFSTGNRLWIRTWQQQGNHFPSTIDLVYTSSDKGRGCGGTLYNYKGVFTSPLYPAAYKNSTACEWDVRVPIGMRVALKFTVFDIQGDCEKNYIKITTYDKEDGNEHRFCKNNNPATLYSNSHLLVKYQSSTNNGGTGWTASFEAVSE